MTVNFSTSSNIVSPHKPGIPLLSDGGICPPPNDVSDKLGVCYFA